MRFLIDAQLPPGLARRLAAAGHEATHVFEILPADASDADVSAAANRLNAVLCTKDEDFVAMAISGRLFGPLLWIRSGNMTTARLWSALEPLLAEIDAAFAAGERIIEVR